MKPEKTVESTQDVKVADNCKMFVSLINVQLTKSGTDAILVAKAVMN